MPLLGRPAEPVRDLHALPVTAPGAGGDAAEGAGVASLLSEVGLPADAAAGVHVTGHDPVLPSKFPVAMAAATALAACGRAATLLWRDRTGEEQEVSVDVRRAAASLVSFTLQRLDGEATPRAAEGNPLVALYPCRDGRWIHLHGAFPSLAARTRQVLGLPDEPTGPDRQTVAAAVARFDAADLEDALAAVGACGAMVRTAAQWQAHPQAEAMLPLGRVDVVKVGDSDPEPVGDGSRILGGTRVLDLTRVLAGPTHGRMLAEHGADVLLVNSPTLPNVPAFVMDTGHGKRSAFLDLDDADQADRLRRLASTADVFTQGYRGGSLERRGFGMDELVARRPGLIYVSINCYGAEGPWQTRPGWEQLAQSVTGLAAVQGEPDRPQLIPAAPCDYTTGYLAALGTLAALRRRSLEGGSYHVRASLCQTGRWLSDLGSDCDPAAATGLGDLDPWTVETATPFGRLRHLSPVAELSRTPARWDRPTVPLGTHSGEWAS